MTRAFPLRRRDLFRLLGGGIVVLVGSALPAARAQEARRLYPEDVNAYLVIGADGRVSAFSGKVELGQGALTAQAQMVAEELGIDLPMLEMVLGDTDRCPWDMGTFGSLTVRMFGPALRAAAAQARLTLLDLAARRLGVPRERLEAGHGVVSVIGEPARRVGYGELSKGARIVQVVGEKAVLRAAKDFAVMGRSPARLDGVAKVTGGALYAADIRRPGMLYARLLRPPVHGATLQQLDTTAAVVLPGVKVLREGELVAVLHADPQQAEQALESLRAQWREPPPGEPPLDPDSIFEHLLRRSGAPKRTLDRGDVAAARAAAPQVLQETYRKGYVAHAPIEPHAALAEWRDGRMTVWSSTQTPFPTRDTVAQALGLGPQAVRVVTPYVGGGFGGKSSGAQAVEAARLARLAGVPVQVAWTREEEFFFDTFDPAAVARVSAALGADGRIAFWDYEVCGAGERGSMLLYDVPHARVGVAGRAVVEGTATGGGPRLHPFNVGPWRAPGANMNTWAIESHIDALAVAARADPVAFRLRHLSEPRQRRVLEAAAAAFGWTPAPGPSGRGFGVACGLDAGTCVAAIAEVAVDRASGRVAVRRIVCAQDMGIVVNPEGAKMQIEGGLTMGLGYTLSEELRFRDGDVLDRNFSRYRIPRFSDVPRIEAVLVRNDELAPQGGGEPAITVTGAVVANAVFDAIGVRATRLPLTPQRLRQAMAEKVSA